MNTHSAHEYAMFAPAQLLYDWHKQRLSNQGYLNTSVMGEAGNIYYVVVDDLIFAP
jgi:hypothetical protein